MSDALLFIKGHIVTPQTVLRNGEMEVRDGRVRYVGPPRTGRRNARTIDVRGAYIVPGFIDFQVNDADIFRIGQKPPDAYRSHLGRILRHQLRQGVTALYLATVAQPIPQVESILRGIAAYRNQKNLAGAGSRLLGALVEGTFMNPACSGAHNPADVHKPSKAIFQRLLQTGAMQQINIVPEWGSAALALIRHATDRGVLVGAGHCRCTAEELRAAVDAGLRWFIHLTNGPTGSVSKVFADGGALEGVLTDDRISASIIVDNYHVHPRYVRDIITRKGYRRIVIISDLMFASDKKPRSFDLNGVQIRVATGGAYAYVAGKTTPSGYVRHAPGDPIVLAGNACWAMDTIFGNTVHILSRSMPGVWYRAHPALPFDEAVRQAAHMAATNPARLAGEDRTGARIGRIARGYAADFTIGKFSRSRQRTTYQIQQVYQGGVAAVGV